VDRRYLGYNFAGPVAGSIVPQRLQNLCIRDYASARKLSLTFTVSEYWHHERALMLFAQLGHGAEIAGFVFYSLQLLPADDQRRRRFFDAVRAQSFEVHFALEELAVTEPAGVDAIERVYRVRVDPRLDRTREALLRLRGSGG